MHPPEHIMTRGERGWKWFSDRAHGKHAVAWLAVLAFFEPIFSPIVPETLMAAMLLARSDNRLWKKYAAVTTISSVLGGVAGYGLGYLAMRAFGLEWLSFLGLGNATETIATILAGNIFLIMIVVTFTPLPDKAFTIVSGFLGVPLLPFVGGYIIGRTARFTLVAYLVHRFGSKVLEVINKYSTIVALGTIAILVAYAMVHLRLVPGL
jgi:membrane protein YqaA with SNARE-associated domain